MNKHLKNKKEAKREKIKQLYKNNVRVNEIARQLNISRQTVYKYLKEDN